MRFNDWRRGDRARRVAPRTRGRRSIRDRARGDVRARRFAPLADARTRDSLARASEFDDRDTRAQGLARGDGGGDDDATRRRASRRGRRENDRQYETKRYDALDATRRTTRDARWTRAAPRAPREREVERLLGALLQVRDQIRAVFRLLQAGENHLRARDVLLRVQQVIVQGALAPGDALVLVRRAVRETLRGAGDAAEQAAEVGTLSSDRARVARVSRPSRFALRASRASNPRARASRVASRRASPRPSRDPRVVVVSSAPACVHRPSPRRGTARTWS